MRKVSDDENMTTNTRAVRDVVTIVEALDEMAPDAGHPAVLQAGVAAKETMIIAAESGGNERTIRTTIGEDVDIVHRKSVGIDAIATGLHTTIKRGRQEAIGLHPDLAHLQGARAVHRHATPCALGAPCLPSKTLTHRR